MNILAFGDVHGLYRNLTLPEDIDLVIFSGDYSGSSGFLSSLGFVRWFEALPYKDKFLVPGNHDYDLEYTECKCTAINVGCKFNGFNVFGSPYTKEFMGWNYMKEEDELRKMYSNFPSDVDILVTHGPPYGILDTVNGEHLGSKATLEYVERVKPGIHIFGHIHEGYGHTKIGDTDFFNVSVCNRMYEPLNPLTVIEV